MIIAQDGAEDDEDYSPTPSPSAKSAQEAVVDFSHVSRPSPSTQSHTERTTKNNNGNISSPFSLPPIGEGEELSPSKSQNSVDNENLNDQGRHIEDDNLSAISENFMEDREMGDTAEEVAVKKEIQSKQESKRIRNKSNAQNIDNRNEEGDADDVSLAESDRVVGRGSLAHTVKTNTSATSTGSYFYDNMIQGLSNANAMFQDSAEFMKKQFQSYTDASGNLHAISSHVEIRDYYPRMGWHDVQVWLFVSSVAI